MNDSPQLTSPDWGALGLAVALQFGVILFGGIVTLPFLLDGALRPGLVPILVAIAGGWPVMAAAAVLSAKRRAMPWRDFVGAQTVRPIDVSAAFVGVALQLIVGVLYALAGFDDKKVSGPARSIADRAGGVGLGYVVLTIFVAIGAPLFEELFYRGVVLNAFAGVAGLRIPLVVGLFSARTMLAIALSSVWFGLIHFQLLSLPALIAAGVCCAVARVKTGRLATAFFLHAGFNLTTMVLLGVQIANK